MSEIDEVVSRLRAKNDELSLWAATVIVSLSKQLTDLEYESIGMAKKPTAARKKKTESSSVTEAMTFLRDLLSAGVASASSALELAKDAGISRRSIERAKASLGVKSKRIGGAAGKVEWMWEFQDSNIDDGKLDLILKLIKDRGTISKRDIHIKVRGLIKTASEIDRLAGVLIKNGLVVAATIKPPSPSGGRPYVEYSVVSEAAE